MEIDDSETESEHYGFSDEEEQQQQQEMTTDHQLKQEQQQELITEPQVKQEHQQELITDHSVKQEHPLDGDATATAPALATAEPCPHCDAWLEPPVSKDTTLCAIFCQCCQRALPLISIPRMLRRPSTFMRCMACAEKPLVGDAYVLECLARNKRADAMDAASQRFEPLTNKHPDKPTMLQDPRLQALKHRTSAVKMALKMKRAVHRQLILDGQSSVANGRVLYAKWLAAEDDELTVKRERMAVFSELLAVRGVEIPHHVTEFLLLSNATTDDAPVSCETCHATIEQRLSIEVRSELGRCDCCQCLVPLATVADSAYGEHVSVCKTCYATHSSDANSEFDLTRLVRARPYPTWNNALAHACGLLGSHLTVAGVMEKDPTLHARLVAVDKEIVTCKNQRSRVALVRRREVMAVGSIAFTVRHGLYKDQNAAQSASFAATVQRMHILLEIARVNRIELPTAILSVARRVESEISSESINDNMKQESGQDQKRPLDVDDVKEEIVKRPRVW